jgi:hypothetical protein
MLEFNITTPFHKYRTITGRFGYSETEKHLVAEVKGPSGGTGIEILFNILSFNDFDVKFSLETPMEFLTKALVIGKLKKDMVSKGFICVYFENVNVFHKKYLQVMTTLW